MGDGSNRLESSHQVKQIDGSNRLESSHRVKHIGGSNRVRCPNISSRTILAVIGVAMLFQTVSAASEGVTFSQDSVGKWYQVNTQPESVFCINTSEWGRSSHGYPMLLVKKYYQRSKTMDIFVLGTGDKNNIVAKQLEKQCDQLSDERTIRRLNEMLLEMGPIMENFDTCTALAEFLKQREKGKVFGVGDIIRALKDSSGWFGSNLFETDDTGYVIGVNNDIMKTTKSNLILCFKTVNTMVKEKQ